MTAPAIRGALELRFWGVREYFNENILLLMTLTGNVLLADAVAGGGTRGSGGLV